MNTKGSRITEDNNSQITILNKHEIDFTRNKNLSNENTKTIREYENLEEPVIKNKNDSYRRNT